MTTAIDDVASELNALQTRERRKWLEDYRSLVALMAQDQELDATQRKSLAKSMNELELTATHLAADVELLKKHLGSEGFLEGFDAMQAALHQEVFEATAESKRLWALYQEAERKVRVARGKAQLNVDTQSQLRNNRHWNPRLFGDVSKLTPKTIRQRAVDMNESTEAARSPYGPIV